MHNQRSLFLGTFWILQIISSDLISLVIFKCILRIHFFCKLHLFLIIVVMGIGSEEFFVFHDQWLRSSCIRILMKGLILRHEYSMKENNKWINSQISNRGWFIYCHMHWSYHAFCFLWAICCSGYFYQFLAHYSHSIK